MNTELNCLIPTVQGNLAKVIDMVVFHRTYKQIMPAEEAN
jgi:hypothetical protein